MWARSLESHLRGAVDQLQSSSRRVWWTTFVLVTLLSALWGIANPPFAGPDEPSHVKRAIALDHGELTGDMPSRRSLRRLGDEGNNLVVRVPEVLASADPACFAFKPDTPAACLVVRGSSRETETVTTAGRHPPAYYAIVGVVSLLYPPGVGTLYLMRFIGALITGAFIATAMTALRRTAASRVVAIGLLLAISPMVLFVSATVNPSVVEVAAALAFWVCGLVLISEAAERISTRLVTAVGFSACALTLSRQLAPLWVALIALTICGFSNNRDALRNLARSSLARFWFALTVACSLAQVGWVLIVKPLDASLLGRKAVDDPASEILRSSLGATAGRYREMIGLFGWLDTPSPAATYFLWTAALGFLVLTAIVVAKRRHILLLLGLIAATVILPTLLESRAYRDVGAVFWQGRYTLPFAVGIPILAAASTSSTQRGRRLAEPRLLWIVGGIVVVGSTLAFAQNLRRYTVGYNGDVWFWLHPQWSPPVSPLLVTIGYVVVMVAFVAWTLVASRAPDRSTRGMHAEVGARAGTEPRVAL
jgi:hypothetical protein